MVRRDEDPDRAGDEQQGYGHIERRPPRTRSVREDHGREIQRKREDEQRFEERRRKRS
jgi:hypothetical protein